MSLPSTEQSSNTNPNAPGLLLSSDLLFTVRICDTARVLGFTVLSRPASPELILNDVASGLRLLIIDLDNAASVLPQVPALRTQSTGLTIIAFGSHVERDVLQRARQAGCHLVLPRSKMTTQLAELLQLHLADSASPESPTK